MLTEASATGYGDIDKPYLNFLEVFGLKEGNNALRSYMSLSDTNVVPPQQLIQYSSELARSESQHPLLGYASAWAAAGAGLHNGFAGREFSYEERVSALDFAALMWQRTDNQFALASSDVTGERKSRLLDLSYRSAEALACLPNMIIVAAWNSGIEVSDLDVELAQLQTKNNLLRLVTRMRNDGDMNTDSETEEHVARRKNNLQNEILGILLPQGDLGGQVLVYPASLQQDHNSNPRLRADLIVVDTGLRHTSGLAQVTSTDWKRKKFPEISRMFISTGLDLALEEGQSTDATVVALMQRENRVLRDGYTKNRLLEVSAGLSNRMLSFVRGTTAGQIPVFSASFARR